MSEYGERAVETSTANENCKDDNWGDWVNLCYEADKEIAELEAQAKADQLKLENYSRAMSELDGAYKNLKREKAELGAENKEHKNALAVKYEEFGKRFLDEIIPDNKQRIATLKLEKAELEEQVASCREANRKDLKALCKADKRVRELEGAIAKIKLIDEQEEYEEYHLAYDGIMDIIDALAKEPCEKKVNCPDCGEILSLTENHKCKQKGSE